MHLTAYLLRAAHHKSDPNTHSSIRQRSGLLLRARLYPFQNPDSLTCFSEQNPSALRLVLELSVLIEISGVYPNGPSVLFPRDFPTDYWLLVYNSMPHRRFSQGEREVANVCPAAVSLIYRQ